MDGGLWVGADVHWVGPSTDRNGVRLEPGDRAVVIDAGRYHIGSFTTLFESRTTRLSRRLGSRRGVVIRLPDGHEVRVPTRHLRLVAPEHPLRPEPDDELAGWWLDELHDEPTISGFVPSIFPAVCRILHPWRTCDGGLMTWQQAVAGSDVSDRRELGERLSGSHFGSAEPVMLDQSADPSDGELDPHTAAALVELLGEATKTPDDVLIAVWIGWGDIPPQRFPGAAHLDTPARGHFLLRGPLAGALTSVSAVRSRDQPVTGIWWPADRAWFLHTEIDFPWTFLAGSTELMDEAERRADLEAIATTFAAPAHLVEP